MRSILIFPLLFMTGPAHAAINPVHDPVILAKPAPLENMALLTDRQERLELPRECSGYYLRPHKTAGLSRCN
jgi:hypothetical protein